MHIDYLHLEQRCLLIIAIYLYISKILLLIDDCSFHNSTEEYANHFKEMVERGGISVAKAEEEASKLYALNATTYKRSQAVVSSSENGRVIAKKTRPDETQEVSQQDIAEVQQRICANLKNNPQLLGEVFGKDSNTLKREIEEESESNQFAAEVLGLNPTNLRRKDDRVIVQVISKVHEINFME